MVRFKWWGKVISISWAIKNWPLIKSNRIKKKRKKNGRRYHFIQSNFYFSFKFYVHNIWFFFSSLHHHHFFYLLKKYSISNLAEATSVLNFAFGQKEIKTAKVKWGKKNPIKRLNFWMRMKMKEKKKLQDFLHSKCEFTW